MKTHISKVISSCYHELRRICPLRRLIGQDVAQQLFSAFILSRLDYCNSLLSRLPGSTIQPLQRVMNAAARIVTNLSLRDHVKPALKQLHWLPVEQKNYIQAVSVYALHQHRTSTKIPVRLCIHIFYSQWQIPAEVCWPSVSRSSKNKYWIRRTWLLLLRSSRLEHSSIQLSRHY